MEKEHFYGTVQEAIVAFRNLGFDLDFNLEENCIQCDGSKFDKESFNIVAFFRYEGDSDPSESAIVYALESDKGHKGILISNFGANTDSHTEDLLNKLKFKNPNT